MADRVTSHTARAARRTLRRAGSAAILAVIILVFAAFLGMGLASSLQIDSADVTNRIQQVQAYYIADAAIEWTVNRGSGSASPVYLGAGSFTVTSDAGSWLAIAAVGGVQRRIRCQAATQVPSGLDYVVDSRTIAGRDLQEFKFRVVNNQLASVTINKMRVSWDAPVAFFEQVKINVLTVKDYKEVWKYEQNGNVRWANGELKAFNQPDSNVLVGQYKTMEIQVKDYKTLQTGAAPRADFTNTIMNIEFYNNDTLVGSVEVDLPTDE